MAEWRPPSVLLEEGGLPPGGPGCVLTVGTFDGVHVGHRDVLARLTGRAKATGLRSLVVTFDPHPSVVVKPDRAPALLTTIHEKLDALVDCGVDYCAIVPFTRTLAEYTAEDFVFRVLRPRFRMRELVIGFDHGFGRDRAGSVDVLRALGAAKGFPVEVVPAVELEPGARVSSTSVRQAISAGDLDRAARELGRSYSLLATVVHGQRRGRVLGFPTINLGPPPSGKLLPPAGVYAIRAQTPAGPFGGMMNLGPRPTFGDPVVSLEAHLFEADAELYGATVRIDFVARLRDTRKFESSEALIAQLAEDEANARRALSASAGALWSVRDA